MKHKVKLQCGDLHLSIHRTDLNLDQLLDFASRANPKRGFLFVSKILGKHLACSPAQMRMSYDLLARKIGTSSKTSLVIGMAETATGLGAGVAESLARVSDIQGQVIYQQTTRHELDLERFVYFDEVHSHAPDQLIYPPSSDLNEAYLQCERLVLVDDEISTGRTLKELALALSTRLHQISAKPLDQYEVIFVSLVSWLSEDQKHSLQNLCPFQIRFESLLEGSFSFEPSPEFRPKLPGQVSSVQKAMSPHMDLGRRGIDILKFSNQIKESFRPLKNLKKEQAVAVIGTGEFTYVPFLLAEYLQTQGFEVSFQSTTRSPILESEVIQNSLKLLDEHGEGVSNYLHNPPLDQQQIVIAYESELCEQTHNLASQFGEHCFTWICPF